MKRDPRTALLQATADRQDHVLIGRTALLTAHTQSRAQAAEILSDLRTHGIYGGSITYVTVGDVVSFLLKELAVGSSTALSPDIATRDAAEQRLVEEVLAEDKGLRELRRLLLNALTNQIKSFVGEVEAAHYGWLGCLPIMPSKPTKDNAHITYAREALDMMTDILHMLDADNLDHNELPRKVSALKDILRTLDIRGMPTEGLSDEHFTGLEGAESWYEYSIASVLKFIRYRQSGDMASLQNFVSEQFVLYSFQLAFVNAVPAAMPGLHEVLQLDFEGEVIQAENGDLQITLGEVKDRLTDNAVSRAKAQLRMRLTYFKWALLNLKGGEDVRVKLKGHVLILNASWPHKKRLPKAKEEDGIEYELVLI